MFYFYLYIFNKRLNIQQNVLYKIYIEYNFLTNRFLDKMSSSQPFSCKNRIYVGIIKLKDTS